MSKKPISFELSDSSIPKTEKLVHLFGQQFSALYDRDELRNLLLSLIWCSYRKHFTPIAVARGPTSDSGWGCMHRVGQMVVARALQQMLLPNDWIWRPMSPNSVLTPEDHIYYSILSLFEDNPQAPLSLHKITQHSGKPVGAQLSPDVLGFTLQRLWHSSVDVQQFGRLQIVALNSSIVPVEDLRDLGRNVASHSDQCGNSSNRPSNCWQPILAFVPCLIMSGTNHILRKMFLSSAVIGFMGGYNSRALWIIGFIEDECFLALDPHVTQRSARFTLHTDSDDVAHDFHEDPSKYHASIPSQKDDLSFHTLQVNRPSLKSLEGHSGSLALLFTSEESLDEWHSHFVHCVFPLQEVARCHMVSVTHRMPHPCSLWIVPTSEFDVDYAVDSDDCDEEEVNESEGSTLSSRHTSFTDETSYHQISLSPASSSQLTAITPVYASVHLQNRLLYNDWFGKLYRFSDQVKQIFSKEPPSRSLSSSLPDKKLSPVQKRAVPNNSMSFVSSGVLENSFEYEN